MSLYVILRIFARMSIHNNFIKTGTKCIGVAANYKYYSKYRHKLKTISVNII